MCKFLKSKDFIFIYVVGLLGGTVGYIVGRLLSSTKLTLKEFLVFLFTFSILYGFSLEYFYRKRKKY